MSLARCPDLWPMETAAMAMTTSTMDEELQHLSACSVVVYPEDFLIVFQHQNHRATALKLGRLCVNHTDINIFVSSHGVSYPTTTSLTCATMSASAWRGSRHMPGTRASQESDDKILHHRLRRGMLPTSRGRQSSLPLGLDVRPLRHSQALVHRSSIVAVLNIFTLAFFSTASARGQWKSAFWNRQ
jgi:hypothetical protein